jgi:hypothetical protein
MKLSKKLVVSQTNDGDFNKLISDGFIVRTKENFTEDYFDLVVEFLGGVIVEESQREEILTVLSKMEKYQSGKMSDKEAGKMANKLKNYADILSSIVLKIDKNEPLEIEDIKQLENFIKKTEYKFNYNNFSHLITDNFIVDVIDYELLFPSNEYQEQLGFLFKEEQAERVRQQNETIARIMGTTGVKKKNVVDYLKEKNILMQKGEAATFAIDSLVSLPQANDLERVLDWGLSIYNNPSEKIDLELLENDHHHRDVNYYANALKYLGLVFVDDKSLCLTYAGEQFFSHDRGAQKNIILDILMKDDLVAALFHNTNEENLEQLEDLFLARGLSGETIKRRVSCLMAWKKYLTQ